MGHHCATVLGISVMVDSTCHELDIEEDILAMFSGFDDVVHHDRQDEALTTSRSSSSSSDGDSSSVASTERGMYTRKRTTSKSVQEESCRKNDTSRLLFTASHNGGDLKRSKHEEKLIRNRESANKSRLKKKQEKMNLEATISSLREQLQQVERENAALRAEKASLTDHNTFLRGLLTNMKNESWSNTVPGMSVLGIACGYFFLDSSVFPSFFSQPGESDFSGRVLSRPNVHLLSSDDHIPFKSYIALCLLCIGILMSIGYAMLRNSRSFKGLLP